MDFQRSREWILIIVAFLSCAEVAWASRVDLWAELEFAEPKPDRPDYDRREYFGSWLRFDGCLNVRAMILIRDSRDGLVDFFKSNPCRVKSGHWNVPYANRVLKLASHVHIDHVVPLKNAFDHGAHAWSWGRRCHYANFQEDPTHLLAVSAVENRRKSESHPGEYLPPYEGFRCKLLKAWVKVKAVWGLTVSAQESIDLVMMAEENHCRADLFEFDNEEFERLKELTEEPPEECFYYRQSHFETWERKSQQAA